MILLLTFKSFFQVGVAGAKGGGGGGGNKKCPVQPPACCEAARRAEAAAKQIKDSINSNWLLKFFRMK